jgi:hypothetical protein
MSARLVRTVLVGASLTLAVDGTASEQAPPCSTWELEYALSGTIRLADTPFGKGDGAHKIGPGSAILRFRDGRVSMLSYSMRESFTVVATAFFATTTVVTATTTRATPDACGIAADGILKDGSVEWTSKVRGVRTDGTLTCSGKYCGSFGAPPSGTTALHLGPDDVRFRTFELSKDWKTFTMPFTFAAKTEVPKQTSFVALTGREVKRTCVPPPKPCER